MIRLSTLLALALALSACGCARVWTEVVSSAPNRFNPLAGHQTTPAIVRQVRGIDEQFFVDVGPPHAKLAVSILEPDAEKFPEPRGTVLILHGFHNRSSSMLSTAKNVCETGYRSVLVDLRGHGQSTGEYLTYGVQEARDLKQVLDELYAKNLVAGRLGVYGISYGATTGIYLAGIDRRLSAVVAVAPFSNMRDEVPSYVRSALPGVGNLISDKTFNEVVDETGRRGNFDPDRETAVAAIRKARCPILLMHGNDDWLVPPTHSEQLNIAAPDTTELRLIDGVGHLSIWFDPTREIGTGAREWIDRYVGGVEQTASQPPPMPHR